MKSSTVVVSTKTIAMKHNEWYRKLEVKASS